MNTEEVTLGRFRFEQFNLYDTTKYVYAERKLGDTIYTSFTTADTTYTSLIKDVQFLGRFYSATMKNGETYYTFLNTHTGEYREILINAKGYKSFFASFDKLPEDQKKTILPDDSK